MARAKRAVSALRRGVAQKRQFQPEAIPPIPARPACLDVDAQADDRSDQDTCDPEPVGIQEFAGLEH